MVDNDEQVSVIDFDRASLKATADEYDNETDHLARLLNGENVDFESMIGDEWMESDIEWIVWDNYSDEEAHKAGTNASQPPD